MSNDKDNDEINISEEEIKQSQESNNVKPIRPVQYVKPLKLSDMQSEKPPIKEFAIYPILPIQGIIFIFAATGVGKTLFSLNLAYAIAGGGNFLKYKAPKPRKVLYIDGEMSYVDIYQRLMQIIKQQNDLDFPDNFLIYTPDKMIPEGFTAPIKMPKICTVEGQEFYNAVIEKNDIDIIFIDNLAVLTTIDLNSGEEWHTVEDWLLKLRAKGKTLGIVHHAGKDVQGYRGTSRMLDTIDTAISLQILENQTTESTDSPNDSIINSKKFKIVYKKNRSFWGDDANPYEATLINDKWLYRNIELSNMDKVIECLNAGMNQRDIAKELFMSQTTVHRMIKKARKLGLIKD